ncbi:MAG: AEC family transporter [Dorea sp.]|nr:AEC family transporter [Dorea sp.]
MIAILLIKKIISLFIILTAGYLMVKWKMLKPEDSKVISILVLYLFLPASILSSFQVERTPDVRDGLIMALVIGAIIHLLLLIINEVLKRTIHLDAVEQVSLVYSNSANLIYPLIAAVLGDEFVIYGSGYICVQMFLMWSHGKSTICGEKGFDFKKVMSNINMICVVIGIGLFLTGFRFPGPVQDSLSSLGAMIGPAAMIVAGMLIATMNLKEIFTNKRLWLVSMLRLVGAPLLILVLLKYSGAANFVANGEKILFISLLATMAPSASSLTQMAQVYGKDAKYCTAINVATTLLCFITMPLLAAIYQL